MKHRILSNWKTAVLTAAVGWLALHGAAHAQTPVADYQFQNTLDSSVPPAQTLTEVGNGDFNYTTATVNGQSQQVLSISTTDIGGTAAEGGVQTPANPLTDGGTYSIVLLADFDLDPANLAATKVFDFKGLTSDAGLYINDTTGILVFQGDNSTPAATGTAVTPTDTYAQFALTRTAAGVVTGYVNGTQDFQFTDTTGIATVDTMLTVFKDDGTGLGGTVIDEGSQGDLARLRLYNDVLTPGQIAALVPEPSTWTMLMAGAVLGFVAIRRRRAI